MMQYPLNSDYVAAIKHAADNLNQLSHLQPVLDEYGEPFHSSGAFAVVFKMQDPSTGKYYALKCFTADQVGRAEAYRRISEALEDVDTLYFTPMRYYEHEFFVDTASYDDEKFPVLLMEWVEGETMESYIATHYRDNLSMSWLCYSFCKMASWLCTQPFAHGDIKPDNIMVRPDGSLALIDYDGMFVSVMKGEQSPTLGTKGFAHPQRTVSDFDETIDDFSLVSIALSLRAIVLDASLYTRFGGADRLLFAYTDYIGLGDSALLAHLVTMVSDTDLQRLLGLFLQCHATGHLLESSYRLMRVAKPEGSPIYHSMLGFPEALSTEVVKGGRRSRFGGSTRSNLGYWGDLPFTGFVD